MNTETDGHGGGTQPGVTITGKRNGYSADGRVSSLPIGNIALFWQGIHRWRPPST